MWVRCLGVMQVIILALMLIGSSVGAIEETTGQASKEDNKDKVSSIPCCFCLLLRVALFGLSVSSSLLLH